MIYTVTLNPSIDYLVSVPDFRTGMTNRTASEQLLPGGKGINVSIVLKNLGIPSTALGFAAGFTGDEIIRRLEKFGIQPAFIRLSEGFSRINFKLKSIEGTEINGQGPKISPQEAQQLTAQLARLEDGDILFLSGSVPSSLSADTYRNILADLKGRKIQTVVDASGEALLKVLEYRPFLIKPNHHELGQLFGAALKPGEAVIPYGRKLQGMGARNVLISMAGDGAILIAENGDIFTAHAPEGTLKNGVGAGDSMAAGFMAGWMESGDYAHAFCMGVAAGSASAFSDNLATGEEIKNLYEKIVCKSCPAAR
ncbi:tagatose-6-phosphate kinase [Lachnospiraceae bacterium]|jgi:1-phosphofructokinase|nr:1-phosphofructokinase [uncultured Acetatifactor sp.]GFI65735.1 tagatose-6-phosphate kinase [Lachnospiraceae bacterium]